jgi:hypothetical protein
MATRLEIYNKVAALLGSDYIESIDEDRKLVELLDFDYDRCLREVLRSYPYNFARKRAQLTTEATTPVYGWDNAYALPTDCVRILELEGGDDYQVEGGQLLTNTLDPYILYTFLQTDPSAYDDLFVQAFAARMGFHIAFAVTGSGTKVQECWAAYQDALHEARLANARESFHQVDEGISEWTLARL